MITAYKQFFTVYMQLCKEFKVIKNADSISEHCQLLLTGAFFSIMQNFLQNFLIIHNY